MTSFVNDFVASYMLSSYHILCKYIKTQRDLHRQILCYCAIGNCSKTQILVRSARKCGLPESDMQPCDDCECIKHAEPLRSVDYIMSMNICVH